MQPIGRVESLVEWLRTNLDEFQLDSSRELERIIGGLKPVGELTLTAELLYRAGIHTELSKDIARLAWEQTRHGEMLVEILLVRPDLIVLMSLYACLKSFEYSNREMDKLADLLWNSTACQRLEFPYWRKLDILHSGEKLGLSKFPDFPEINCWFSGQPEPWIMSDEIAYGITHAVFYITDFGRYTERISAASRRYLKSWNPAWLNIFSIARNWDVVSELLMVASCISEDRDLEEYYLLVANASERDGMIPSPIGAGRQLIDLEGNCSVKRARFLGNYHTCLVALMAFALHGSELDTKGRL